MLAASVPMDLEEVTPEWLTAALRDYYRQLASPPRTIRHGDFRLDNLLFGGPDGRSVTIIDWQVCLLGRGVADVSYFAAFCLPTEQHRAIERRLVEVYHATLLAGGVFGYSFEHCWEDYRLATLTALLRLIAADALLDVSSDRGQQLTLVLFDRVEAILADHEVGDLLSFISPSEVSHD